MHVRNYREDIRVGSTLFIYIRCRETIIAPNADIMYQRQAKSMRAGTMLPIISLK